MKTITKLAIAFATCAVLVAQPSAQAFKLGIMQDDKAAAAKFTPLIAYLKKSGIDLTLVSAPNYGEAAKMFSAGSVDGMFAGSGVAGTLLIKGVATPVVRPVGKAGWSTYWAVVLAKKGSPDFDNTAKYFAGKKVVFTALGSSGEFFFHSIEGADKAAAQIQKAANHGAAIDALAKGVADIAIVKNRIWDKDKDKYPDVVQVGRDKGENPDNTLVVRKDEDKAVVAKIKDALLAVEKDASPEGAAVKEKMDIKGFIVTTDADFTQNLALLKKAGVTPAFNFSY